MVDQHHSGSKHGTNKISHSKGSSTLIYKCQFQLAINFIIIDEPHYLTHHVDKPVYQNIYETIRPYRKIIQKIEPVNEEIETIVAKKHHDDDYGYGHHNENGGGNGYGHEKQDVHYNDKSDNDKEHYYGQ